jgi:hypothetical protein
VKSGPRWDSRFGAGIRSLGEKLGQGKVKGMGVYAGPRALVMDGVRVLPWQTFLEELWSGKLLG